MRHGVPDDRAFGPEAVRCGSPVREGRPDPRARRRGSRSGGGAGSWRLSRGAAGRRMGRGAGLALHPGEQGLSHGLGEASPDARPARTRAVSGAAPDVGRPRRHGLGHGRLGRPLCGSPSRAVLDACRGDRRPGDARCAAAGPARGRGRGDAHGAPSRRRRSDAQDRAAGRVGPGPPAARRGVSRRWRAAPRPGAGGGRHRGRLGGVPGPSIGAGTGDGDGELLLALESEAEGLTQRDYALRLWTPERVAEEYYTGSWMHERVKRRHSRARAILKRYRDMATGKT